MLLQKMVDNYEPMCHGEIQDSPTTAGSNRLVEECIAELCILTTEWKFREHL